MVMSSGYEIVVPAAADEGIDPAPRAPREDQADRDARAEVEEMTRRAAELALRSQAIQRNLARPTSVNSLVLRARSAGAALTPLQRAEELLKAEMCAMLHYDNLHDPSPDIEKKRLVQLQASHLAYLEQHPYEEFTAEELAAAKLELQKEMEVVKAGMGHGELSMDAYTQVWEECLAQVLFLPGQNRYTRANLASKKDRLESAEKRLEQNRNHMSKEAKKCSKMEKKLRVLTDHEKLHYLLGKLTGKAQAACAGITPSAENYKTLFDTLVNRYEDKRTLAARRGSRPQNW
ncbi:unnamed protein product [Plutella xylostella]|uniref:(diamondback moth) hypothetical protein n=1 Tax=Plutella xylostella TaxID=51655 RepID=A0A8S4G864_PLUXY|nr:unnamed protein product [Plutella xylostella]